MAGSIQDRIDAQSRILRAAQQRSEGADWFGPLSPLAPVAPNDVAGRRLDFRTGINLDTKPRLDEKIDFRHLRALADNCGIVRLVIETRKDQIGWREWEIRPKANSKAKANDPDIVKISNAFEYPDREHDWETWCKAFVEEMLVIDAATVFPRYAKSGEFYGLDLVAGDTIKPVIDDWGRRPAPPYPAYQQILHGLPATDYTASELLYLPRNYRANRIFGFPPTEQIILMINIALRRDWHKLQYYTEGTVPDALAGVPDSWSTTQIAAWQEYFDTLLENDTAQRRKVRFVPEAIGKAFVQTKGEALKDDFDEWLARFVCYAFSVSSQWAVKMMNRSTAESAAQQATEEGLAPLQSWVRKSMNRVIAQVFKRPDLEFAWREDEAVDPAEQSIIDDRELRNGSTTLNEVRARKSQDPYAEFGNEPMIYTATGAISVKDALNPPAPPPQLGHSGGPALDDEEGDSPPSGGSPKGGKPGTKPIKSNGKSADSADMKKAAGEDHGKSLSDLWAAYFDSQAQNVIAFLVEAAAPIDLDADHEDGLFADMDLDALASGAVDVAATTNQRRELTAATTQALTDAGQAGVQAGAEALETISSGGEATAGIVLGPKETVDITNLANPKAVEYANARGAELVSKIDDTTRTQLRNLIATAQEEGWSVAKLKDEIVTAASFDPERAGKIAQHELAAASIRGNLASWQAARDKLGIDIKKRSILGLNEQHCQACLDAVREGAIDLDDSWTVGFAAPFHPYCGCGLVPVTSSKQEGPRADAPFDRMEKAGGNPWHDERGRFTSAPATVQDHDAKENQARGDAAMHQVITHHIDHQDAMDVPGHGPVTFIWGKSGTPEKRFRDGEGIAKIIAKRNHEGHDGDAVARKLPEVIAKGKQTAPEGPKGGQRFNITHDGHTAVISVGRHKDESTRWVLTGWKDD